MNGTLTWRTADWERKVTLQKELLHQRRKVVKQFCAVERRPWQRKGKQKKGESGRTREAASVICTQLGMYVWLHINKFLMLHMPFII